MKFLQFETAIYVLQNDIFSFDNREKSDLGNLWVLGEGGGCLRQVSDEGRKGIARCGFKSSKNYPSHY